DPGSIPEHPVRPIIFQTIATGIKLYDCRGTFVHNNTVTDRTTGIRLEQSEGNTIKWNNITENTEYGMYLSGSQTNLIHHNSFNDNTIQAWDDDNNAWNFPYPDGGNYWSDWTTPDNKQGPEQDIAGSDGIVDVPRQIDGNGNQDRYPLTTEPTGGGEGPPEPYRVKNVDTGKTYMQIKAAIRDSTTLDGHTLLVMEGAFYWNVLVDKQLEIVSKYGKEYTAIDAGHAWSALTIAADYVRISGFTTRYSGSDQDDAGIKLDNVQLCEVENNTLWRNHNGIKSMDSSLNEIYHNNFIENTIHASDDGSNTWNMTYSSGGNYWDDHKYPDNYNGINQDLCGADGIVDKPYNGLNPRNIPDGDNKDNYAWTSADGWWIAPVPLGPVHNIDTDKYYSYIKVAVADPETVDGHRITVASGTYKEKITINKALTLTGSPWNTFIIGSVGDYIVTINSDWVNMSYFRVMDSGWYNTGIYLNNVQHCNIQNNNISNNFNGIEATGSNNNIITNNYLYMNSGSALRFNTDSDNNKIENNTVGTGGPGIWIIESSYNNIANNTITNVSTGIDLYGVDIYSNYNTVRDNNVSFNSQCGIHLDYACYNILTGNDLYSNEGRGLAVYSASHLNEIYHNNFIYNDYQAWDYISNNYWEKAMPIGGNYWSDYAGTDENEDGIGDTPYAIPGYVNYDDLPWMTMNGWQT
ncbi:MAG: right-handed parallel beta-helix repeat-containing protein, partial [Thermoplasmata archaeon]|nr:right-handed parallel beta-helix repeat-containing protein [Thermoplasmata archaeon]